MYDSTVKNGFKSSAQTTRNKHENNKDPFDEMFEFELNIEKHLTPAQKQRREREEVVSKFFTDGVWLKTPEQREAFALLDPHSQLMATFGNMAGFDGSELQAVLSRIPSPAARV